MEAETIGVISGFIVFLAVIPYAVRTYQKLIVPNIVSWGLWTFTGFAMLVTYKSGADTSIWPAFFSFFNPLVILVLILLRMKPECSKLTKAETVCLIIGVLSLCLWFVFRDEKHLLQYALYVAIIADLCACVPTIVYVWNNPMGDRPFAWIVFTFGYGIIFFAITEHAFVNYALPLYTVIAGILIILLLVVPRLRQKIPLREWA